MFKKSQKSGIELINIVKGKYGRWNVWLIVSIGL